ncbi:MFS transporter [Herbaspirillum sp. NPDC087042]|uniref:MFS transporter n=1 Tax=Herbaspirillum sp. NPDC087042 TaxID=3364004 RepID=UPI003806C63D
MDSNKSASAESTADAIGSSTIRKISWRILPVIVMMYFVAYIDRTNVSFAAIGMNRDLGFTSYLYGWGAGIFYLGYILFEVPSNVFMLRTGVRLWNVRILVSWAVLAAAMAFVSGPTSFIVMRFLMGVAEAGFFPGMILYFTFWFPARYRARVIAVLYLAVPGSNAVAAALSSAILKLDGWLGIAGWKWIFLCEGLPALVMAVLVFYVFVDRPADARWLSDAQKVWLQRTLAEEAGKKEVVAGSGSVWATMVNPRVLALSAISFTIITATLGVTYFLPLIIKSMGYSDAATGYATAIPYVVGTVGMFLFGLSSDRNNERKWHFIAAAVLAAGGLIASGWLLGSAWALVAMCVATIGIYGAKPAFWSMPSDYLSGTAAAAGIALVNSVGNLGGFVGPYIVGWLKQTSSSYEPGLYFLAGSAALAGLLTLLSIPGGRRRAPTPVATGQFNDSRA